MSFFREVTDVFRVFRNGLKGITFREWLNLIKVPAAIILLFAAILFGGLWFSGSYERYVHRQIDKNGLSLEAVVTGFKYAHKIRHVVLQYEYRGHTYEAMEQGPELVPGDHFMIRVDTTDLDEFYVEWEKPFIPENEAVLFTTGTVRDSQPGKIHFDYTINGKRYTREQYLPAETELPAGSEYPVAFSVNDPLHAYMIINKQTK